MDIVSQLSEKMGSKMHLRNYMKLTKKDVFHCVFNVKDATHIEVGKFDEKLGYYCPILYPIVDGKIVYDEYPIPRYKTKNLIGCSIMREAIEQKYYSKWNW